jgi:hypothetical protein
LSVISAVVSESIGSSIDHAANLLIRNSDIISAFTEEFNVFLSQCKPLMRIFTLKYKEEYLNTLTEFEREESNTIINTESLSLLTMPDKVASSIMSRIGVESNSLSAYQRQRMSFFQKNLLSNTFTEIIPLFDLETIKSGKVKVSFSDMMNNGSVYYTREEYVEHLEYRVYLLENYKNSTSN